MGACARVYKSQGPSKQRHDDGKCGCTLPLTLFHKTQEHCGNDADADRANQHSGCGKKRCDDGQSCALGRLIDGAMCDSHGGELRQCEHALGHYGGCRQEDKRRSRADADRGKRREVTRELTQAMEIPITQHRHAKHGGKGDTLQQPQIGRKLWTNSKNQGQQCWKSWWVAGRMPASGALISS